jgi:hypothetical protein
MDRSDNSPGIFYLLTIWINYPNLCFVALFPKGDPVSTPAGFIAKQILVYEYSTTQDP